MNLVEDAGTMKKVILFAIFSVFIAAFIFVVAQDKKPQVTNFYETSLHYTNRGLEYWYSQEQGGLERITGIPFSELPCAGCHVRSCDTCHKKEVDGQASYSVDTARAQAACEKCHGMESLLEVKKSPGSPAADVHFGKGMMCLDCHTAREVHGDGTPYNSIQDPGALDVRCENCHKPEQLKCPGQEAHQGKVDCNACHVRDLPSCYNCHFDTRVKEGKSVSLPLKKILFLVNHDGKVTLASLHTFVYQKRTMITFGPSFPHLIMKEGRNCGECHATPIIQDMKKGQLIPIRFENGKINNIQGIIPVLEGWDWNFVFLNYENGNWVPLDNPAEPLINYSGYCSPLTREQFLKLGQEQSPPKK
jgi:hypothetical protein